MFNSGAAVAQSISAAAGAASRAALLRGIQIWSPAQVSVRVSTSYTANISLILVCIAAFSCASASAAGDAVEMHLAPGSWDALGASRVSPSAHTRQLSLPDSGTS